MQFVHLLIDEVAQWGPGRNGAFAESIIRERDCDAKFPEVPIYFGPTLERNIFVGDRAVAALRRSLFVLGDALVEAA